MNHRDVREAWLVAVSSGNLGTVNVDGENEIWWLTFLDPTDRTTTFLVEALGDGSTSISKSSSELRCEVDQPIQPLASRHVLHDAVARFEEMEGLLALGDGNNLFLEQAHECVRWRCETHHVIFQLGGGDERWYANYTDDGEFVRFSGPCALGDTCGPCGG